MSETCLAGVARSRALTRRPVSVGVNSPGRDGVGHAVSARSEMPALTIQGMTAWADGRGIVKFPDGRRIRGRGLRQPLPSGQVPEFAVYLLARDPGPFDWEHRWVRWSDFRTPACTTAAICALRDAYERSPMERVEIACRGGVGRTGTALAAIAVLSGVPRAEAVAWVRREYNERAAETPRQRRWILEVEGLVNNSTPPRLDRSRAAEPPSRRSGSGLSPSA